MEVSKTVITSPQRSAFFQAMQNLFGNHFFKNLSVFTGSILDGSPIRFKLIRRAVALGVGVASFQLPEKSTPSQVLCTWMGLGDIWMASGAHKTTVESIYVYILKVVGGMCLQVYCFKNTNTSMSPGMAKQSRPIVGMEEAPRRRRIGARDWHQGKEEHGKGKDFFPPSLQSAEEKKMEWLLILKAE